MADQYEVLEDVEVTIDAGEGVLANDLDADGDPLNATLIDGPSHGTLELRPDGSFVYVSDENYFGDDQFRYSITDGVDTITDGVVDLTVTSVNDSPTTAPDTYLTLPGQAIDVAAMFGLLANDSDVEGSPMTAALATAAQGGQVQLNDDGSFSYVPNAGFTGIDTFEYVANDGTSNSEATTVTIRVQPQPVVINEVLTASVASLETRVRDSADDSFRRGTEEIFDWIEVKNPFDAPLSIGGFYLTDDPDELTKWQIPAGTSIEANGHLLFFASGERYHRSGVGRAGDSAYQLQALIRRRKCGHRGTGQRRLVRAAVSNSENGRFLRPQCFGAGTLLCDTDTRRGQFRPRVFWCGRRYEVQRRSRFLFDNASGGHYD